MHYTEEEKQRFKDLLLPIYNNKEDLIDCLEDELTEKDKYIYNLIEDVQYMEVFKNLKQILNGGDEYSNYIDDDYTPILLRFINRIVNNIIPDIYNTDPLRSILGDRHSSPKELEQINKIRCASINLCEAEREIYNIKDKITFVSDLTVDNFKYIQEGNPWTYDDLKEILKQIEE